MNMLENAAQSILDELDSRYDGAPDSKTLWMGEHIESLQKGLCNPESEHIENIQRLREVVASLSGEAGTVYCDRRITEKDGVIKKGWCISIFLPKTRAYIYSGDGPTFREALDKCLADARKDTNLCEICGGRTDGECASHPSGCDAGGVGMTRTTPSSPLDLLFMSHRIGTMAIVMNAAWIHRCEECGAAVDGGDRLCGSCKEWYREPDYGPVTREIVREETRYEQWKESRALKG